MNFVKRKPVELKEIVTDKELSAESYLSYNLIRLLDMFHYENLPKTIPPEELEKLLLMNGTCFITKVNDKLYALKGSVGGPPDPYYRPTLYVVANPALNLSESYDLWEDGVLMRNDSLWYGLANLLSRYSYLMAENLLTMRTADVLLRLVQMISASNDKDKIAADIYIDKIEKGELSAIQDTRFMEGIRLQSPTSQNTSYVTQFIELHQYYKGSFYNEIGLLANFNMKREALGAGETNLNQDSIIPLCDDMLKVRKEDVSRINEMFGTDITVEFNSVWKQNQEEIKLQMQIMQNEAGESTNNQSDSNDPNDSSESTNKTNGIDSGELGNSSDPTNSSESTNSSDTNETGDSNNNNFEDDNVGLSDNISDIQKDEPNIEIVNVIGGDVIEQSDESNDKDESEESKSVIPSDE